VREALKRYKALHPAPVPAVAEVKAVGGQSELGQEEADRACVSPPPSPFPPSAVGAACALFHRVQFALRRIAGKPVKEFVHVDMAQKMAELRLDTLFPAAAWPGTNAVRELATRVKALKRGAPERLLEPFVCAELKKCVPLSFPFAMSFRLFRLYRKVRAHALP